MCDMSQERQRFHGEQKQTLDFVILTGPVDDPEDEVGNTEGYGELVDSSHQYESEEPEIC